MIGMRAWGATLLVLLGLLGVGVEPVTADVVRVVVERQVVLWEGRTFGAAGSYEFVQARVHFLFDPTDPADAAIVDLALAPRNGDGLVEAEITVYVLQPADVQRRRGVAWVDLDPWGAGPAASLFAAARTGTAPSDQGWTDALLLDEGLTLIQLHLAADGVPHPEAPGGGAVTVRDSTGGEVIGWVRRRWEPAVDTDRLDLDAPMGWHHPVAMPAAPVHRLFVGAAGEPATDSVPDAEWALVPMPGGGDARWVAHEDGFEAGRSYELVYRARTPRLQGLSLAVVRDIMAYARHDLRSVFPADRGIAFGAGSGGRLLRQFLHDGFNDAHGRPAFDLVWAHGAGAGRGDFNRRFAQPAEDSDFVHLFPFTLDPQFDPVSGREDGLLAARSGSAPRTVFTHPGADYRQQAASLTHTTVDGLSDRVPDGRHRAYHLAGVRAGPPQPAEQTPDARPVLRALAVAAVGWVAEGTPMPASRVPSVGAGTLVRPPAVAFSPLGEPAPDAPAHRPVFRLDAGPRFDSLGIADRALPLRGPAFPVLLPQLDGFGNELGGVRPLELRVPLGTYPAGSGASLVPFAQALEPDADDPRPVLSAVYGSEGAFLARVRTAVEALVAEGFLLERDRAAVIAQARRLWSQVTASPPSP